MPRRIRPHYVPLDGRPLSRVEIHAARAHTLALLVMGAAIKNQQFVPQHAAIRYDLFDDTPEWIVRQLRPLREQSRTIRDLVHILDEGNSGPWDNPSRLRRIIRRLQREIARLQPPQASSDG